LKATICSLVTEEVGCRSVAAMWRAGVVSNIATGRKDRLASASVDVPDLSCGRLYHTAFPDVGEVFILPRVAHSGAGDFQSSPSGGASTDRLTYLTSTRHMPDNKS
jgi:hypothetical protein